MATNEAPNDKYIDPIAQIILNCKAEAEYAKRNRMLLNQENFDIYHLRQDYTGKKKGQSQEFLAKQSMAVEQVTSFLQQGLMDEGEWFRVNAAPGVDKPLIHPDEIQKLTLRQLNKNKFPYVLGDLLKLAQLGSLMICKVGGEMKEKATYEAKKSSWLLGGKPKLIRKTKDVWQTKLSTVRQEDFFPDPHGEGLYEIQRIEMDYHDLIAMAELGGSEQGFDLEAIRNINFSVDDLQKQKKARETDQNSTFSESRKRVTLYEYWGTMVEPHSGKVLHKNIVSASTAEGQVIRHPTSNPFWHNESPFVVNPIIRVPNSVWHKAMMDAATKHNISLNELYNLMLDASMMSVFGIRQVRTNWLEDPNQITDGVPAGETLKVNAQCPPGAKVLERVDTSALSEDAIQMFNLTDREFQQSAFTNDTRLGSLPQRQVKATELVQSNQAITGVFNGLVKGIEELGINKIIEKVWLTSAQHMNDLDSDEVEALVGKDRAQILSALSAEEIFADTAVGHRFETFGLSATLNKVQDYRKIQSLLQSIGASPEMTQDFKAKYSMTKLLGEIIKSLDIDETKITMTPEEQQAYQQQQQQQQQMQMQMMQMEMASKGKGQGKGGGGLQAGAHAQSQIPQTANSAKESGAMMPTGGH